MLGSSIVFVSPVSWNALLMTYTAFVLCHQIGTDGNQYYTSKGWYCGRTRRSMRARVTQLPVLLWRLVRRVKYVNSYPYDVDITSWFVCVYILRCILKYRNICVCNMAEPPKGKDSLMKLLLSTTPGNTAVPSIPVSALQASYFVLVNSHRQVLFPWLLCWLVTCFIWG